MPETPDTVSNCTSTWNVGTHGNKQHVDQLVIFDVVTFVVIVLEEFPKSLGLLVLLRPPLLFSLSLPLVLASLLALPRLPLPEELSVDA